MHIVNLLITLDLPYVKSKKGRRKIINSIKERLSKHNLSILDISSEYPKEAEIAIAFLSLSEIDAKKKIQTIEKILDRYFSDVEYSISYEIL
ncbi:DUF503 family protein [Nitrosophilus kaiyonis]|uniref:DUF503 family protein n=1 Tax=Nitrosophilus kaiyonis TaxID=2930200 RepID=UPI0024907995|nr:DUF503 family protein [Nitrosophilus kaiyonis]